MNVEDEVVYDSERQGEVEEKDSSNKGDEERRAEGSKDRKEKEDKENIVENGVTDCQEMNSDDAKADLSDTGSPYKSGSFKEKLQSHIAHAFDGKHKAEAVHTRFDTVRSPAELISDLEVAGNAVALSSANRSALSLP